MKSASLALVFSAAAVLGASAILFTQGHLDIRSTDAWVIAAGVGVPAWLLLWLALTPLFDRAVGHAPAAACAQRAPPQPATAEPRMGMSVLAGYVAGAAYLGALVHAGFVYWPDAAGTTWASVIGGAVVVWLFLGLWLGAMCHLWAGRVGHLLAATLVGAGLYYLGPERDASEWVLVRGAGLIAWLPLGLLLTVPLTAFDKTPMASGATRPSGRWRKCRSCRKKGWVRDDGQCADCHRAEYERE